MNTNENASGGDSNRAFKEYEVVRIRSIPKELLADLPVADQQAIVACVDKLFTISGFNSIGEAEIEFEDSSGDRHTIWIAINHLEKALPDEL